MRVVAKRLVPRFATAAQRSSKGESRRINRCILDVQDATNKERPIVGNVYRINGLRLLYGRAVFKLHGQSTGRATIYDIGDLLAAREVRLAPRIASAHEKLSFRPATFPDMDAQAAIPENSGFLSRVLENSLLRHFTPHSRSGLGKECRILYLAR